jgi:spore coat protein CotF
MTTRILARDLISLKTELQDIEVKVLMPNGEIMSPKIKFVLRDKMNLDLTKENVEFIYLTCD